MRFLTDQECAGWLEECGRVLPDSDGALEAVRIAYPAKPYQYVFLAKRIAGLIEADRGALLWLTEWGIWPSSENWHLYRTLRAACGDRRALHEAPGHLADADDAEAFISLLQVAMLSGWGGWVLSESDRLQAFFSHDEYVDFFARDPSDLTGVRELRGNEED